MPDTVQKRLALVRIAFGVVWAIDAAFKFVPAFYRGITETVVAADSGLPGWLNPWFHAWFKFIGAAPGAFAVLLIVLETLIAVSLLAGVGRRLTYVGGAVFSFLIWAVAEGFGGPYAPGSTDIGAGIIYVFVFAALYAADDATEPAYSLLPLYNRLHSRLTTVMNRFHRQRAEA